MRIAILNEYFYPEQSGGTPTVLSQLAHTLKANHPEISIDVFTSRNMYRTVTATPPEEEIWDGIHIHRLSCPKSNRPSMALRFLAGVWFSLRVFAVLCRHPRFDLVFVLGSPPPIAWTAQAYSRLFRVPYLYLIHDLYPDIAVALGRLSSDSAVTRLCRRLQKGWIHDAAHVAVLGRCMRHYLHREYAISPAKVAVLPNWSVLDTVRPQTDATRFRQQHGLDGYVVLYAGNLGEYNNIDQIIDAARELRKSKEKVNLVLIGAGSRKEAIAARIAEEQLDNIRLLPSIPSERMGDMLASVDVSLIPLDSRLTGLGVPSKLYSSLAAGRPIIAIAAAESEPARVTSEEQCGLWVPPGDANALAQAILTLQRDPALAAEMGRRGRRSVEQRYSLQHITEQFYHLVGEIADGVAYRAEGLHL
ncbi:MAG: glycosyltransferase family 4 protein [Armatimonadota bacterium]